MYKEDKVSIQQSNKLKITNYQNKAENTVQSNQNIVK